LENYLGHSAFTRLTGYVPDDVFGQKTNQILNVANAAPGHGVDAFKPDHPAMQADRITRCAHKSGRSIRSRTTFWALSDEGMGVFGHAAMIRDVDATLDLQNVMAELYETSASQTLSRREKIHAIMRIGCEFFRMPTALYASKNKGRNRVSSATADNVLDLFGSGRGAFSALSAVNAETGNG
jgi:hypothetical protein